MKKTYDLEMIRDFMEHLGWELRIKHFENTHEKGMQHPELTEQLKKCMVKRNTIGLLYANRVDKAGLAEDKAQEVIATIREVSAMEAQEALDALDILESTLDEALNCASHPDDYMTRTINLVDFLRHMEEQVDEES
ncbi:hypothetical protein ACFL6U_06920 [Planctomycetota bacterium]